MALGADIILASLRGKRTLSIEDFFTGKGESPFALEKDELVEEIRIPRDKGLSGFQKLTYRSAIDFALVSSGVKVKVEGGQMAGARIAIGGAGASPLLLKEAASLLEGKPAADKEAIREAADQVRRHASAFMVDNLGLTLEYRKKMAQVMTKRALLEAIASYID
jgi:CO/xanthine dehydrogenase FAD-binding subunit